MTASTDYYTNNVNIFSSISQTKLFVTKQRSKSYYYYYYFININKWYVEIVFKHKKEYYKYFVINQIKIFIAIYCLYYFYCLKLKSCKPTNLLKLLK